MATKKDQIDRLRNSVGVVQAEALRQATEAGRKPATVKAAFGMKPKTVPSAGTRVNLTANVTGGIFPAGVTAEVQKAEGWLNEKDTFPGFSHVKTWVRVRFETEHGGHKFFALPASLVTVATAKPKAVRKPKATVVKQEPVTTPDVQDEIAAAVA